LPSNYYFGFSAATGGLSDNHDVMAMTVNTMDPVGQSYNDNISGGASGQVYHELLHLLIWRDWGLV
jgi:hypothetical protein